MMMDKARYFDTIFGHSSSRLVIVFIQRLGNNVIDHWAFAKTRDK